MRFLILTIGVLFSALSFGQNFTTHTFFSTNETTLALDLFLPDLPSDQSSPLVIYVHGGGFSSGDRSEGHALGQFLQQRGIACATISYSLSMKGRTEDWSCNGILTEKIKTIQLAANQTWLATTFLLKHAADWQIDNSNIFLAGTSAGAETILHAAYWDREQMAMYQHQLAKDFHYAGLISGAGAIMDLNLITTDNHLPTFFMHGDADTIVPYGTAAHHYCPPHSSGWLMLFGTASIAKHLETLGGTHQTFSFKGAGHEVCGHYFHTEQQALSSFINRVVTGIEFQEWVWRLP
ncbi:MAG: alpha/beta hydrolase [Bacteroidota bacterium]